MDGAAHLARLTCPPWGKRLPDPPYTKLSGCGAREAIEPHAAVEAALRQQDSAASTPRLRSAYPGRFIVSGRPLKAQGLMETRNLACLGGRPTALDTHKMALAYRLWLYDERKHTGGEACQMATG